MGALIIGKLIQNGERRGITMKEIILEGVICAIAAGVLMILHELVKAIVYMGIQRHLGSKRTYSHSIWEVYRYLDPVGIILSVTSSVAFSRPFMFRIQSKKINRTLGITGFAVLLLCFCGSMAALKLHILGVSGMTTLEGHGILPKLITLYIQYTAIISLGMLVANLFPISIFDMGLVIAGFSSQKYLGIIKMDGIIKVIFVITLFMDLIHYGCFRFIMLLL